MEKPRVYADFHNADPAGRVRLNCVGTVEDLERQGVQLREGLVLTLYADDLGASSQPDDLQAEGVVTYSGAEQCWVAEIDWSRIRHASDDAPRVNGHIPNAAGDRAGR